MPPTPPFPWWVRLFARAPSSSPLVGCAAPELEPCDVLGSHAPSGIARNARALSYNWSYRRGSGDVLGVLERCSAGSRPACRRSAWWLSAGGPCWETNRGAVDVLGIDARRIGGSCRRVRRARRGGSSWLTRSRGVELGGVNVRRVSFCPASVGFASSSNVHRWQVVCLKSGETDGYLYDDGRCTRRG